MVGCSAQPADLPRVLVLLRLDIDTTTGAIWVIRGFTSSKIPKFTEEDTSSAHVRTVYKYSIPESVQTATVCLFTIASFKISLVQAEPRLLELGLRIIHALAICEMNYLDFAITD